MNISLFQRAAAAVIVTLAALATPAAASTCYVVLDKSDTVIYQGARPPVDLSVGGATARDAMRKRGEHMEMFETTQCPERNALTRAGKGEASVDEIVAGIRPYQRVGRTGVTSGDDNVPAFAASSTDRVVIPLTY